jgi:hypothetical protein
VKVDRLQDTVMVYVLKSDFEIGVYFVFTCKVWFARSIVSQFGTVVEPSTVTAYD